MPGAPEEPRCRYNSPAGTHTADLLLQILNFLTMNRRKRRNSFHSQHRKQKIPVLGRSKAQCKGLVVDKLKKKKPNKKNPKSEEGLASSTSMFEI